MWQADAIAAGAVQNSTRAHIPARLMQSLLGAFSAHADVTMEQMLSLLYLPVLVHSSALMLMLPLYADAASAAPAETGKPSYDGTAGSGTARMLAMLQPHGVCLVSPDVDTAHIPLERCVLSTTACCCFVMLQEDSCTASCLIPHCACCNDRVPDHDCNHMLSLCLFLASRQHSTISCTEESSRC